LKNVFQIPKDSLSNSMKLSVSNKRTLLMICGIFFSHQKSLYLIKRSPKEEDLTVLGYADVSKILSEVNGVVGLLFKVCESYYEAHLYLKEHFRKDHPIPLNVAAADSPFSFPEVGSSSPPFPPEEKRSDLFKASKLDVGGRSVIGEQSKVKEGKLF
jgi:hypothetical protein